MLNRSARAALSFLNDLLYQLSSAFISLVITPLIVANLGTDIFGAWKIITKTTDFLTLANFKPLGLLRLTLAKDISNKDYCYKQQQIGAALSLLILTLPLVLILSGLIFYFRNLFIPVSTEISYQVNLTLLLMLSFTLISPFCQAPDYIVYGLNMHYKRFGVSSITIFITALVQYSVVIQGYTLPWFAAASCLPMFAIGIVSYTIILKNVPWFKLIRPPTKVIGLFFRKNLWMFSVELFRYVFSLADLILIGIYFGTTVTAVYALTKTLIVFLFTPVNSLVCSALPGIGDLVGREEKKALLQLRSEQINIAIFLGFIIGMTTIFFNEPFIKLWVDETHFAGEIISKWIIMTCIIDLLVKVESLYLDAFLKLKMQTAYLGSASVVYLAIIIVFKPVLGLSVIPIAQIVSQLILIALYWTGFKDCLHIKFSNLARTVLRPLSVAMVLAYSVSWLQLPVIDTWIELFVQAFRIGLLAALLGWILILQKNTRKKLLIRLSNVFEHFRK